MSRDLRRLRRLKSVEIKCITGCEVTSNGLGYAIHGNCHTVTSFLHPPALPLFRRIFLHRLFTPQPLAPKCDPTTRMLSHNPQLQESAPQPPAPRIWPHNPAFPLPRIWPHNPLVKMLQCLCPWIVQNIWH